MKRNVWVFGLISGLLISVFMTGSMAWCYQPGHSGGSMVVGYTAMLLAFSLIFVAVKNQRDKYNNGVISFGKAFQIGLLISLICSTMYVIAWAVEYHFFMPDFMDRYTANQIKALHTGGAGAAEIAEKTQEFNLMKESYKNPVVFALYTYMEIFPVGLIVSLITALILKKKANEGEFVTA
jgi:flagellar biosynthesis protein FliQ